VHFVYPGSNPYAHNVSRLMGRCTVSRHLTCWSDCKC